VKKKGPVVLLDALELLSQQRTDWCLTVVGDGPERTLCEQRVAQGSLAPRVRFRGWVSQIEVVRLLSEADLLVVPSVPVPGETEGIPNVILEAFAARVPVVASDVGGISEVVKDGETGILVPPGNRRALADRLLRVCCGEEQLDDLAAAAGAMVEQSYQREHSLTVLAELHRKAVPS
jgi:glycosyltransferase involved in cell wall biosynthesis